MRTLITKMTAHQVLASSHGWCSPQDLGTHGLKKKYPARRHPGDPGRTPVCHLRSWCPGRTTSMDGVRPGHLAEWGGVEMHQCSLFEKRHITVMRERGGGRSVAQIAI